MFGFEVLKSQLEFVSYPNYFSTDWRGQIANLIIKEQDTGLTL